MLLRFLRWVLIGPETFWPGQRVMLVSGYPSDIAATAHRTFVYGTVHPYLKDGSYSGNIQVLWDGFEGLRHHTAASLSGRILALESAPSEPECHCSARSTNDCVCPL